MWSFPCLLVHAVLIFVVSQVYMSWIKMSWLCDVYKLERLEFTCKFEPHFHVLLIFVASQIYVSSYTCLQFICLDKCTCRQKLNLHVKFACLVDICGMIWYDSSITRLVDICDMAWHGSNKPASAWTCHGATQAILDPTSFGHINIYVRVHVNTHAHTYIYIYIVYVYNTHPYVCDSQRTISQPKPKTLDPKF